MTSGALSGCSNESNLVRYLIHAGASKSQSIIFVMLALLNILTPNLWFITLWAFGFPHVSFAPTGAAKRPGLVWFLD
jgi:hypothetical protein